MLDSLVRVSRRVVINDVQLPTKKSDWLELTNLINLHSPFSMVTQIIYEFRTISLKGLTLSLRLYDHLLPLGSHCMVVGAGNRSFYTSFPNPNFISLISLPF